MKHTESFFHPTFLAGVGGIEAEAVMLGQPISMVLPQVIGYKLMGNPHPLVTSTDIVLTITKVTMGCCLFRALGPSRGQTGANARRSPSWFPCALGNSMLIIFKKKWDRGEFCGYVLDIYVHFSLPWLRGSFSSKKYFESVKEFKYTEVKMAFIGPTT